MKKTLKNFLNGAAFGITQIVPGVSGGTVAIILGFYYELLGSINNFRKDYKNSLKFLCPLLVGTAAGILAFASVINFLLKNYSFPTMLFFIGLIIGIIPVIYTKIKDPERRFNLKEIMLILVPVLILIIVSVLKNSSASDADGIMPDVDVLFMFFLFFVGILAAAALVIPGISGSFIFLLFGVYPLITSTLSSVRVLPGDIANARLWLDVIKVLGPLATGIIIGGLCAARLIVKLLDNYYKITYSIILGLLAGSVYTLLNDPIVFYSGASLPVVILGAQMLFIGAVISFVLGKKRF